MANISFGFNQLGKITPDQARWIPRIWSVVSASVIGFLVQTDMLTPHAQNIVNQVVIYFTPITLLVANMFGVTPDKGDSVQITSAEVEPKKVTN